MQSEIAFCILPRGKVIFSLHCTHLLLAYYYRIQIEFRLSSRVINIDVDRMDGMEWMVCPKCLRTDKRQNSYLPFNHYLCIKDGKNHKKNMTETSGVAPCWKISE